MNMKKSIAGVMAGAMAVSAMATTASAWTGGNADQEQIAISYDLKKYVEKHTDTVVTITNKFDSTSGYDITAVDNAETTGTVTFGYGIKDVWCATGSEIVSAEIAGTGFTQADGKTYTFDKLYYSKDALGALGVDSSDYVAVEAVNGAERTSDKSAINVTFTTLANATAKNIEGAFLVDNYAGNVDSIYHYEAKYPSFTGEILKYGTYGSTEIAGREDKTVLDAAFTETYKEELAVVEKDENGHWVVAVYPQYVDAKEQLQKDVVSVKYLDDAGNAVAKTSAKAYATESDAQAAATAYATTTKTFVKAYDLVANSTTEGYAFSSYTVTCTYNVHVNGWDDAGNYKNASTVVNKSQGIQGLNTGNPSIKAVVGSCYYDVYPMKSTLSKPADVIEALKADKEYGNHYTAPLAVSQRHRC